MHHLFYASALTLRGKVGVESVHVMATAYTSAVLAAQLFLQTSDVVFALVVTFPTDTLHGHVHCHQFVNILRHVDVIKQHRCRRVITVNLTRYAQLILHRLGPVKAAHALGGCGQFRKGGLVTLGIDARQTVYDAFQVAGLTH